LPGSAPIIVHRQQSASPTPPALPVAPAPPSPPHTSNNTTPPFCSRHFIQPHLLPLRLRLRLTHSPTHTPSEQRRVSVHVQRILAGPLPSYAIHPHRRRPQRQRHDPSAGKTPSSACSTAPTDLEARLCNAPVSLPRRTIDPSPGTWPLRPRPNPTHSLPLRPLTRHARPASPRASSYPYISRRRSSPPAS
jgi:hypothetical protein